MSYLLLTWEEGLCRHGCGSPLARPRNRFINGHDSMLLDVLLDAHKAGDRVMVRRPDESEPPSQYTPEQYAQFAFFERGLRWFRIKAGIAEPAYDELAGADDPDVSHLDLGSPPAAYDINADLVTVRDVVARAVDSADTGELAAKLAESRATVARLVAELEAATRPVNVDSSGLAELSDREVLRLMVRRARAAADHLARANYDGDAGEVWDLLSLLSSRWVDPVRVGAARLLLGQESL